MTSKTLQIIVLAHKFIISDINLHTNNYGECLWYAFILFLPLNVYCFVYGFSTNWFWFFSLLHSVTFLLWRVFGVGVNSSSHQLHDSLLWGSVSDFLYLSVKSFLLILSWTWHLPEQLFFALGNSLIHAVQLKSSPVINNTLWTYRLKEIPTKYFLV